MSGAWFTPVTRIAAKVFVDNLEMFLKACPGWSRGALLRTAKADAGLIRRIEDGASFQTGAVDKLQRTMEDVLSGKITRPSPYPIDPKAKAKLKARAKARRLRKARAMADGSHGRPGRPHRAQVAL